MIGIVLVYFHYPVFIDAHFLFIVSPDDISERILFTVGPIVEVVSGGLMCSLCHRSDWESRDLKVRRRRKHRENYANKKHEVAGRPPTPL